MTTKQLTLKHSDELKKKQIAQEQLNRLRINNEQSVWLKPAPPTPALKNNKQKEKEEETNRLIPCGNCGRAGHTVAACLNPHNPYAPN